MDLVAGRLHCNTRKCLFFIHCENLEPILALYAGESSEIREHTNLGVKQLSITYGGAQYAVIETTQALSIEF